MDAMTAAPAHARTERLRSWIGRTAGSWSAWEITFGAIYALACPLVGFFAFVEIYQTVTHLVHRWFGDWAWIVPASAEGLFTALFAGWMLLELRDKPRPPRRVRFMLAVFTGACMAGSYWLNIAAAGGGAADAVAHAVVVTAFFGVLMVGKVIVRRLKVTPAERALEAGTADARQYAIDLVRAVKGRGWRWSGGVPSLLKRQITSGRLPDAVRDDVKAKVSAGRTSGWQESVRGWVFGPDGLGFAALAAEASRIAISDIARDMAGDTPSSMPEAIPGTISALAPEQASEQVPSEVRSMPETRPEASAKPVTRPALKLASGRARSMSPEQVADHVEAMLEEYGNVSVNRVKNDLHVATGKAQQALDIARRRRLSVVPRAVAGR